MSFLVETVNLEYWASQPLVLAMASRASQSPDYNYITREYDIHSATLIRRSPKAPERL